MPYTKSSNMATQVYRDKHRARIYLDVPRELKEKYRKEAEKRGMSLSRFIIESVEKNMRNGK